MGYSGLGLLVQGDLFVAIVPVSMAERVRVVQLGEEALGKFVAALQCVGGF